jgi:hypothetical protein
MGICAATLYDALQAGAGGRGDGMGGDHSEPTGSKQCGPWNSLEVAKLIMSSATPIMIFVMGYALTKQSAEQAEAREIALRNDATARDVAARRETIRLARLSTLLQKRIEIWDRLGPLLPALYSSLRSSPPDRAAARAQIEEVRRAWVPFTSYFPPKFNSAMGEFMMEMQLVQDGRIPYNHVKTLGLLENVREAVLVAIGGRDVTDDPDLGTSLTGRRGR